MTLSNQLNFGCCRCRNLQEGLPCSEAPCIHALFQRVNVSTAYRGIAEQHARACLEACPGMKVPRPGWVHLPPHPESVMVQSMGLGDIRFVRPPRFRIGIRRRRTGGDLPL